MIEGIAFIRLFIGVMDENQSQIVGICEQLEGANVFVVRSIAVRCAVAALSGKIERIDDNQPSFRVFKTKFWSC